MQDLSFIKIAKLVVVVAAAAVVVVVSGGGSGSNNRNNISTEITTSTRTTTLRPQIYINIFKFHLTTRMPVMCRGMQAKGRETAVK
jgi:hypothetical protein